MNENLPESTSLNNQGLPSFSDDIKKTQLSTFDIKHMRRDVRIAEKRMKGMSVVDIAREEGISHPHVSRILAKTHIKGILENTITYLIMHAPDVAKNLVELTNYPFAKERLDAIKEFNKVIGISQTHAPLAIQNLYMNVLQQTVSADLVQLLGQGMDTLTDEDVLDITESSS